jgi:CheY-like chemotaxis protein
MAPLHRILVVDDNDALRENLAELLEAEGYEVAVAEDGAAALERLAKDPLPDLVLLDLLMPVLDGRETLARIRQDPRLAAMPVVLSTGAPSPHLRASLPANAFLPKPFGMKELLVALEQACPESAG